MNPLTVSALTTHIVALIERDETLRDVQVTGEVSNWRRAASGHIYFSLKDSGSTIAAVMWRGNAAAQSWFPTEGDQIIAQGNVGVFPDRGVYQLYVNRMHPAGRGELYVRFEELVARLNAAGLFDAERKRPIDAQPRRLAVVTSADAAALRDVLRVLSHRWPLVDVILFATLVQGGEAPRQIVEAIGAANRYNAAVAPIDTLLLVRGGGSIEDLWAFNDEQVAYAVAQSEIPVVSGVGHETDTTIVDFAADLRAPTPSAAAAIATPDRVESRRRLESTQRWLAQFMQGQIENSRRELRRQVDQMTRLHPSRSLDRRRQRLDEREQQLHLGMLRRLRTHAETQRSVQSRLLALSPRHVLARGYSIVRGPDGSVVRSPAQVAVGDPLTVAAAGGDYGVTVSTTGQADLNLQEVKE